MKKDNKMKSKIRRNKYIINTKTAKNIKETLLNTAIAIGMALMFFFSVVIGWEIGEWVDRNDSRTTLYVSADSKCYSKGVKTC